MAPVSRRSPSVFACAACGPRRRVGAFTLVELLLAMATGLVLFGLVVQLLLAEERQGAVLVRQWRERTLQRRTLDLVRSDLRRAMATQVGSAGGGACPLAGREPVLQIHTAEGPITYTLGSPPSPIWRGRVLMRCGPAFGLDGEPSRGESQNRVVIDALAPAGFRAETPAIGRFRLSLEQEFPQIRAGGIQKMASAIEVAAPAPGP